MEYVTVESLEELEELYIQRIITYYQYLNIKEKLKNKSSDEDNK